MSYTLERSFFALQSMQITIQVAYECDMEVMG
jgi:hypothetical protein